MWVHQVHQEGGDEKSMMVDNNIEVERVATSEKTKKGTYRKLARSKQGGSKEKGTEDSGPVTGKKRSGDEVMEMGDLAVNEEGREGTLKKQRLAGLADQPCRDQ